MLQAARIQSKAAESKLRNLLDESDLLFHPLCDPLLADAGLNRCLREDREEAYSDWLAWVLQQIGNAEDVLKLLRIDDPEILERCHTLPLTVSREKVIACGRLDLVIRISQEIVVLIEVKIPRLKVPKRPNKAATQYGSNNNPSRFGLRSYSSPMPKMRTTIPSRPSAGQTSA
jgi:hypothetical protein